MKIYTKVILDSKNNLLEEKYFTYDGPIANCGIHYTYGANKNAKLMEKKAKRERKLAEKRAKRQAREGTKKEVDVKKSLDISKPITLDFLTNPDKK
tara:strand:+ start:30 stop:317 length:288 start_codon:yes stop_codon:yes gene_type:complete